MMMGDKSLEEPKPEKDIKGPMALPVGPIALAQARAQAQAQAQAQAGVAVNGAAIVPPTELETGPSPVIGSTPPADTQDASKSVPGWGVGCVYGGEAVGEIGGGSEGVGFEEFFYTP